MEQLEAQEVQDIDKLRGWTYHPPEEKEEEDDDVEESMLVEELRREIDESTKGKLKLISENSMLSAEMKGMRLLLMDFQDLFIQLLAHKRINKLDVPEVVNLLQRSGIHESDLRVRAGQGKKDEEN